MAICKKGTEYACDVAYSVLSRHYEYAYIKNKM